MGALGRRFPGAAGRRLMIDLLTGPMDRVVLLAAHCDDLAIGMGATIMRLAVACPALRVDVVVLTGRGTAREDEERAAFALMCPDADLRLSVHDLPDGRVPSHFDLAKDAIVAAREAGAGGLIFAPQPADAHQDHRAVGQIAPTVFRDHLILGYEILKWESDLPTVSAYQPLEASAMRAKLSMIRESYPSQGGHDWFDDEAFLGLARIRGVQCHAPYAEAFVAPKLTLSLGRAPTLEMTPPLATTKDEQL